MLISENRSASLHTLFFMKVMKKNILLVLINHANAWSSDCNLICPIVYYQLYIHQVFPFEIPVNTAIATPPSPNPKIFWSEYEVQHKLNQFVQQNIEGFYWTSHVYRMYKETFQIKAGLKRNTSKGELWSYRSNKRKEERREPRHRLVTGQQTVVLI